MDGIRIRRIAAESALRERIIRGEIAIVRCQGRYDLVPADIALRIRERDERAVMAHAPKSTVAPVDDGYAKFSVPDDLVW